VWSAQQTVSIGWQPDSGAGDGDGPPGSPARWMGKGWQLAVSVAFFIVGFARCFSLVFNSFLELAVRILEAKKNQTGEFLLMVCALPKKPSNLVNKITSPIT